jgi:hypothetical protein
MNRLARLRPAHTMAASADVAAVCADCACAARLSEEEVRDFCSLLSLADRVLLASSDADATAAQLLSVCLDELGFLAQVVDARTMHWVEPSHTVVGHRGLGGRRSPARPPAAGVGGGSRPAGGDRVSAFCTTPASRCSHHHPAILPLRPRRPGRARYRGASP